MLARYHFFFQSFYYFNIDLAFKITIEFKMDISLLYFDLIVILKITSTLDR